MKVPYFEFRPFPSGIEEELRQAVLQVMDEKQFILGRQVAEFEREFAGFLGVGHVIGTGNGYDALVLALKALQVQPADEVIVPANTFVATANAVAAAGAKPVLAEPDEQTCNLTAASVAHKITSSTRVIIPVHLYGQACDMDPLMALAEQKGIAVLEDLAQSQGASYKGRLTGSIGTIGATSFYPVKNLGAMGDAGAVVTNNAELAAFARQYGNYGQSAKYHYEQVGVNSRLDTLQAAVLQVKLRHLHGLNQERQRLAQEYLRELAGTGDLVLPYTAPGCGHIYHVFCIRSAQRDRLQQHLHSCGISTLIHYPVPVHLQQAYRFLQLKKGELPVTEMLAQTSLSLPLFPGMQQAEQQYVVECIRKFYRD